MKTLNLINTYLSKINEQAEEDLNTAIDATDVTDQPDEASAPLTTEGERRLVDLLVKAFLHVPTDDEENIVTELQTTLLSQNPKSVADTIEKLLSLSPESTKDTLNLTTDINQ